jgi:cellobiose-specific phosphotransferase system component IIB
MALLEIQNAQALCALVGPEGHFSEKKIIEQLGHHDEPVKCVVLNYLDMGKVKSK